MGQPALIVGYAAGKKGRVMAVVIRQGKLCAVKLKHVELDNVPEELKAGTDADIVPLARRNV